LKKSNILNYLNDSVLTPSAFLDFQQEFIVLYRPQIHLKLAQLWPKPQIARQGHTCVTMMVLIRRVGQPDVKKEAESLTSERSQPPISSRRSVGFASGSSS